MATGRDSWVGWAELKTAPVDEVAVMNTGRVIRDVDADILAVVEAENRVALKQFSEFVFDRVKEEVEDVIRPYTQIMLIDVNDDRGIDMGLMTKEGFDIGLMQSHIHDLKPDGNPIFSRDCPEYAVTTPSGELIWVIPNHFKSKLGGNDAASIAKREAQATRVAEIYQRLRDDDHDNIVILGDLNDSPDSEPLQPLLAETDLRDVSEHDLFDTGEFKGREGKGREGKARTSVVLVRSDWATMGTRLTISCCLQRFLIESPRRDCFERELGRDLYRQDGPCMRS